MIIYTYVHVYSGNMNLLFFKCTNYLSYPENKNLSNPENNLSNPGANRKTHTFQTAKMQKAMLFGDNIKYCFRKKTSNGILTFELVLLTTMLIHCMLCEFGCVPSEWIPLTEWSGEKLYVIWLLSVKSIECEWEQKEPWFVIVIWNACGKILNGCRTPKRWTDRECTRRKRQMIRDQTMDCVHVQLLIFTWEIWHL